MSAAWRGIIELVVGHPVAIGIAQREQRRRVDDLVPRRRKVGRHHHRLMIDRGGHVEEGPADPVVAAPVHAVKGANVEGVSARARLIHRLCKLGGGDLNEGAGLRHAGDNKMSRAGRNSVQLVIAYRVAIDIAHREQRRRADDLSFRSREVRDRHHRPMIDGAVNMEERPADAIVAAPIDAIEGANIEGINAGTRLIRSLRKLRSGDLDEWARLRHTVHYKMTYAGRDVVKLIISHRVAVGITQRE